MDDKKKSAIALVGALVGGIMVYFNTKRIEEDAYCSGYGKGHRDKELDNDYDPLKRYKEYCKIMK